MKINLFLSYYVDQNPERQDELYYCLESNLTNLSINRVLCFPERPTYKSLFLETANYPDDINIICNSDILFDDTLNLIKEFAKKAESLIELKSSCFALTRWDLEANGISKQFIDRGSQDIWVFFGAVFGIESMDCNFELGQPGCDNAIAWELKNAGYKIYNPSESIRCYHLHNSGIRNYHVKDTIVGNHLLLGCTSLENIKNTEYWERLSDQVREDVKEKVAALPKEEPKPQAVKLIPQPVKKIPEPKIIVRKEPIKVFHIALMAGENGFTKELKKLGQYQEINYQHMKGTHGIEAMNFEIKRIANEFKPDLVFCQLQESGSIYKETLQAVAKESFVIVWTGDIRRFTSDHMVDLIGIDNLVCSFSNDRDINNIIGSGGKADFLQIGVDIGIFKPNLAKIEGHPQICFMGQNYGKDHFPLSNNRAEMVEVMRNEFMREFALYGNGWHYLNVSSLMSSQHEEARVYNSCKIGINYSHFEEQCYTSDRLMRIMSSGCMALSHWFPKIEQHFEIGKHLDVFRSMSELKEKCHFYLNNEAKRLYIAEQGMIYARDKFSFESMVDNIYLMYKKHENNKNN